MRALPVTRLLDTRYERYRNLGVYQEDVAVHA
jgi:hypothetical protein